MLITVVPNMTDFFLPNRSPREKAALHQDCQLVLVFRDEASTLDPCMGFCIPKTFIS